MLILPPLWELLPPRIFAKESQGRLQLPLKVCLPFVRDPGLSAFPEPLPCPLASHALSPAPKLQVMPGAVSYRNVGCRLLVLLILYFPAGLSPSRNQAGGLGSWWGTAWKLGIEQNHFFCRTGPTDTLSLGRASSPAGFLVPRADKLGQALPLTAGTH